MANIREVDLERLAEEELLREATIAAARAEVRGDWQPRPLLRTNKAFLHNTVISTVSFNTRRNKKKTNKTKVKNPCAISFTKKKKKTLSNNTFTVKMSSKPVNPKPLEKPISNK